MLFLFLALFNGKEYTEVAEHGPFYLKAGKYTVKCYGAQGGAGYLGGKPKSEGGKGAYVKGTMIINGPERKFYAFVGGQGGSGKAGPNKGGFNGGGNSGKDSFGIDGNDAAGGGGGATDLRIDNNKTKNRIIVAAGGSGGAGTCNGAMGGELKCIKINDANDYTESEHEGKLNGQGDDGENAFGTVGGSGSGAGGGWRGGVKRDYWFLQSSYYKAVSDSGSSHISGYKTCENYSNMTFIDGEMKAGDNEGNGKLIIETLFECSTNCHTCKSATECTKCFDNTLIQSGECVDKCDDGYVELNRICEKCSTNCKTCSSSQDSCDTCNGKDFLYNHECYSDCPKGTFASGSECFDCDISCESCSNTKEHCLKCAEGYYFNNNRCYLDCTEMNDEASRQFYGKDDVTKECKQCTDYNCVNCAEDFTKCNGCNNLFVVESDECVHPNYVTLVDENCSKIERCNYTVYQHRNVLVKVLVTTFSGKVQTLSGGAIYLINCALICNRTDFINCKSINGGGGAIYVKNTFDLVCNITLYDLYFTGCEAIYGGAIYIYSGYELSKVYTEKCRFLSNTANSNKNDPLFGGSAFFLTAKDCRVINCTFKDNKGSTSGIKIYNVFDENIKLKSFKHINDDENYDIISITNCEFFINKADESSITVEGWLRNLVEIDECIFNGKLRKGSYYISGKIKEDDISKLQIKSCQFEDESNNTLNIKLVKEIFSHTTEKKWPLKSIICVGTGLILIVTLICIGIYSIKKAHLSKNIPNNQKDNEDIIVTPFI